ncbi:MAG: hypothetical protein RLZZ125_905, partial [Actinomycetota bacterium]
RGSRDDLVNHKNPRNQLDADKTSSDYDLAA